MRSLFSSTPSGQSKEKRRSFAFMKYSPADQRSSTSMRRTREHAKQIAMQLAMANEAASPMRPVAVADFDPFPTDFAPIPLTQPTKQPVSVSANANALNLSFDESASVTSESSSAAFSMDVIDPMSAYSARRKKNTLDMFVEQQQPRRTASSVVSDASPTHRPADRTVNSMPTFPSNSSMQAKNITVPSSAQSVGSSVGGGAAARRRLRRSQELQSPPLTDDYLVLDEDFSPVLPPRQFIRSGSNGSMGSNRSNRANHLVNYSQSPRPPIPFTHVSSTVSASTRSNNSSDQNMFDDNHGFTFDAFGLDATQVDQEVNAALQDLVGSHPDLSFFLGDEEFPLQNFDSPGGSSRASPVEDMEGFTDGFRVAGLPLQVRQSPTNSERSSLTSTSTDRHNAADGRVNLFKEQAGFHRSSSHRKPKIPPQDKTPEQSWANFRRPTTSQRVSSDPFASYPRSHIPVIPSLIEESSGTELQSHNLNELARSDTEDPSDIIVASDAGVVSDVGVNSDIGVVPEEVVSARKVKPTKATQASRIEEKKEDGTDTTKTLNWKALREQRDQEKSENKVQERRRISSPPPTQGTPRIHSQLQADVLNQEKVERKWPNEVGQRFSISNKSQSENSTEQKKRADECIQQRTSFQSYRERLKPAQPRDDSKISCSKSETGGYRGTRSTRMQAAMSKLNNRSLAPSDSHGETQSEAGSTPAFLAKVKLRNTGGISKLEERRQGSVMSSDDNVQASPSDEDERDNDDRIYEVQSTKVPYHDQREQELKHKAVEEEPSTVTRSYSPQKRQLTYRERREMELRRQRAEQERKEAEEREKQKPERDVASLIRRRIAANKRSGTTNETLQNPDNNVTELRTRLKNITVAKDDGESADSQTLDSNEYFAPTVPVQGLKQVPSSIRHPVQRNSSPCHSDITSGAQNEWHESNDASSQSHLPPSMVSSEVDSSSTTRSYIEPPAIQNRNQAEIRGNNAISSPVPSQVRNTEVKSRTQPPPVIEDASSPAPPKSTKSMLNAFFAKRLTGDAGASESDDDNAALIKRKEQQNSKKAVIQSGEERTSSPSMPQEPVSLQTPPLQQSSVPNQTDRPALKDDPKYDRYFRMLKVGMPMDVVKHAMTQDGMDSSVMDGDHQKPAGFAGGVPLKDDPKYDKYFKMMKIGLPLGAIKNAMERDGLDPSVMDGDHNLPAGATASSGQKGQERVENKPKDTHRRTRLHWETLRKVRANSLWAKIGNDPELEDIDIDEEEFAQLFQAELTPSKVSKTLSAGLKKRGAAVRVIEAKRANNGGIILARLKMTHDDMADAVDRIDENDMTAEQMQNIIEYLPTADERTALEAYMLEGGQDAAEKFDGLCECEKFMVSMMTVEHAKRKVRALLFKLQFESCLESLQQDAHVVEAACDELSNSVRLRKLLGIVLNIGNRLNTAGVSSKHKAGAFSLNSLLKLSHAKAFDKKTTFLHYVILVVQRNNELLLRFKDDIPTALKADKVYWDQCLTDLEEVENQLENVRRVALYQARLTPMYHVKKKKPKNEEGDTESLSDVSLTLEEEVEALRSTQIGLFTLGAIKRVSSLRDTVEATKSKFAHLLEYFGEEDKGGMQPHELFRILVTFSREFDKAKEQVFASEKNKQREERKRQASDKSLAASPNAKLTVNKGKTASVRASNMQPNMSSVMKDISRKQSSQAVEGAESTQQNLDTDWRLLGTEHHSPRSGHSSSNYSTEPAALANSGSFGRGLSTGDTGIHTLPNPQAGSHLDERDNERHDAASTSSISKASMETHATLRQKARLRRKVSTGKTSYASVSSSTNDSFPLTAPISPKEHGRPPLNQNTLSPRSSIRQRRRLEQRKHQAGGADVNGVEWPSEDLPIHLEVE